MTHLFRVLLVVFITLSSIAGAQAQVGDAQSYGVAQLTKMLRDRPALSVYETADGQTGHVTLDDSIVQSAVAFFSSDEPTNAPVAWNGDQPDKHCEIADHSLATSSDPAAIRLATVGKCAEEAGAPLGFEELWSSVFFEFYNIQGDQDFATLTTQVYEGKLDRAQWIRSNTEVEYRAELKRLKFYHAVFLPWAEAHGLASESRLWEETLPATYDGWIALYTDPNSYPWDFWGKYFDDSVVPYLKSVGIPVP